MRTKDIMKSDKAWQLGPNDAVRLGDWIEFHRGIVVQVIPQYNVTGLLVSKLNSVGFLGLFKARAFRTGMVNV